VDIFKGICKLSKQSIQPDDASCEKAERIAKCKFCTKYTAEKEYLGKCMLNTLAYSDMIAASCADFEWIRLN